MHFFYKFEMNLQMYVLGVLEVFFGRGSSTMALMFLVSAKIPLCLTTKTWNLPKETSKGPFKQIHLSLMFSFKHQLKVFQIILSLLNFQNQSST